VKRRWIVLLGAALVVSSMVGAQSVLARGHSAKLSGSAAQKILRCTAKGSVTYMYWGDSGDNAAHKSSIAVAEKKCPVLHVNPI
jgi:ABC-type glycerol-3-phosphate transport system substrate-binding protein